MNHKIVPILRYIPLILVSGFIFYMSSQNAISVSETKSVDVFTHKLAHVIEYATLYIAFLIAFYKKHNENKILLFGIIFVAVYGMTDEIHQSFNPTRSPKVSDVFVDTFGGILGALVSKIYIAQRK